MIARALADAAGDLLLGARCVSCDRPGRGLCEECRAEVARWRPHAVAPTPCPARFPRTFAAAPYAGLAAAMISAHKERQALSLASPLGGALAASLRDLLADTDPARIVLVPAPSSARANRERGLDAGRAIALSAARRWRRRDDRPIVVRSWLRQHGTVRDQSGLAAEERAANLAGALTVRRWIRARPGDLVVLCDDVTTTGATLTEARRALESAGIAVSAAATVAATTKLTAIGTYGRAVRRLRTE
ncbi:ComF family protein [Microlunatus ginsengisoli]|uniref:ComF family protein n=1 Tax=Microlunatus ginsengisoli TaxID=363863 RepID=A0ABP6Z9E0_9ACTN